MWIVIVVASCTSTIKDNKSEKENPENIEIELVDEYRPEPTENLDAQSIADLIGYWVGWFEPDLSKSERQALYDKGYYPSANKINISIDNIVGDSIFGHSVVASNARPFKGEIESDGLGFRFNVIEPGDDKYDGTFEFYIPIKGLHIEGKWVAYDSTLNVFKRSYKLAKKIFKYNPNNILEDWFTDETKQPQRDSIDLVNLLDGRSWEETLKNYLGYSEEEIQALTQDEKKEQLEHVLAEMNESEHLYYTVSAKFDKFNSSIDTLTTDYVSELSKADIYILRNSIFARHGYSFKKKDLRLYFDRMSWYIPVHANIRTDLTDLEKQNIKLLLAYEEHAEEYYDSFGR